MRGTQLAMWTLPRLNNPDLFTAYCQLVARMEHILTPEEMTIYDGLNVYPEALGPQAASTALAADLTASRKIEADPQARALREHVITLLTRHQRSEQGGQTPN
jgi:hypothetical protein